MPAGNMGSCSCGIPLSYPKAFPLATSFFLDHSVFINDLKLPVEIRRSECTDLHFVPDRSAAASRSATVGFLAPAGRNFVADRRCAISSATDFLARRFCAQADFLCRVH